MEHFTKAQLMAINIFNLIKKRSKSIPKVPDEVWRDPLYFIAFGLGSGAIPFAPGTFGTLFAIPFYLLLREFSLPIYLIITLLFIVFSAFLSDYISKKTHTHDHPGMCIDEFAGFFVTMINAPHGLQWVALGFILFRVFDIWKPWPIHVIDEKVQGGFGMVLDDILAGIFGLIIIQVLARLL